MPYRKSDVLMNAIITLLLTGIFGVCGLGVKIAETWFEKVIHVAEATLEKVAAIEVALSKEVERTTADREAAERLRVRFVTMIDRLAETQGRVAALETRPKYR